MQKASSHRVHLNAVQMNFEFKIKKQDRRRAPQTPYSIHYSQFVHSAGGQMDAAPTHCMQSVSGLFHSLKKGSFHLSLAVLVHYRLPRSI